MTSPSPAEEFASLINQYDGRHDLNGYEFNDFTALEGKFLDEFLSKAKFSHRGAFARLHLASRSLRLFQLEFQSIPTGSSGVPHVHEELEEFPMDQLQSFLPRECATPLFQYHHRPDNEAEGKIFYSREIHVQMHFWTLLKDVIRSCNYKVKPDTEAALNGLKIDIGVIRNLGDDICGTIEIKQPKRPNAVPPDPDPMNHPKVMTQILDQMIPLRTLYGVKNVYGILSTYKSWRFFRWVPSEEETKTLELGQMVEEMSLSPPSSLGSANPFVTPQKAHRGVDEGSSRKSPPASPRPYCDADADDDDEDLEEDKDGFLNSIKQGTLYASDVISDEEVALKVLAWVLGEMEQSPIEHIPAYQCDYLYVVRKEAPGGYEKVKHTVEFYKGQMPKSDNKRLYLLDELGHRYHGRVFRAMSRNGNLCVLKYFVKSQPVLNENGKRIEVGSKAVAEKAVEYWNKAYRGWIPLASWGKWGGGDAMIMPDLEKMSVDVDRSVVMQLLEQTMRRRFFDRRIWHGDPAWRNVAIVRDRTGDISKVCMIDLEPQWMIEERETTKWKSFETMWEEFSVKLDRDWDNFVAAENTD